MSSNTNDLTAFLIKTGQIKETPKPTKKDEE